MKVQHFYTKLPCQKPKLKLIKWGVQNGLITKNGLLPLNTTFLKKYQPSIRIP